MYVCVDSDFARGETLALKKQPPLPPPQGTTSGSLSLIIKHLLSGYHFECYFIILAAQMGLQLGLCILTRDVFENPFGVPVYDRAIHMKSLRMGVTNVLNVAVGFIALKMVNVPMFLCIRRLMAPTILAFEYFFEGGRTTGGVYGAVSAILLGTIVAGWDTLSSDIVGYTITLVNNLFSAAVRGENSRKPWKRTPLIPPLFSQSAIFLKNFSQECGMNALGTLCTLLVRRAVAP